MAQLTLFENVDVERDRSERTSPRRAPSPRGADSGNVLNSHRTTASLRDLSKCAEQIGAVSAPRADEIVRALHETSYRGFRERLEPLLTDSEREKLSIAGGLPYQCAIVLDHVVERLTRRWGELNGWSPFGRIATPGTEVKKGLRVMCLELFAPSRGLKGTVAFRVERNLRHVTQPIPVPVLELVQAYMGSAFHSVAFLEPLFSTRGKRRSRTVLRSLGEVRREHCRPIDPLVIGWLGAGPANYGLRFPAQEYRARSTRRSTLGETVFLIGHWD